MLVNIITIMLGVMFGSTLCGLIGILLITNEKFMMWFASHYINMIKTISEKIDDEF